MLEVTEPDQLFACEPYAAVLLARACVSRQGAAREQEAQEGPGRAYKPTAKRGDYGACRRCEGGQKLAERLAKR